LHSSSFSTIVTCHDHDGGNGIGPAVIIIIIIIIITGGLIGSISPIAV
jgi:hypothetical protein